MFLCDLEKQTSGYDLQGLKCPSNLLSTWQSSTACVMGYDEQKNMVFGM